jgi:membrane associated rhomboid family serine protease
MSIQLYSEPLFYSSPLNALRLYLAAENFNLEDQGRAVGELILFAWAVHVVDWGLGRGAFSWAFGIRPREITGLFGVVCAPFLHSVRFKDGQPDNSHIISNTVFFAILGLFIAVQGLRLFYAVSVISALFSGLGTWLFGRENTYHIGASGVIYGYIGFLLVYGLVSRNILAMALGIITFLLYGRYIIGILPTRPNISWEGHLFGFIGGVFAAYLISYIRVF